MSWAVKGEIRCARKSNPAVRLQLLHLCLLVTCIENSEQEQENAGVVSKWSRRWEACLVCVSERSV